MRVSLPHAYAEGLELVGRPLALSATPVEYRRAPPALGEHTREVLRERLGLDEPALDALAARGVIAP